MVCIWRSHHPKKVKGCMEIKTQKPKASLLVLLPLRWILDVILFHRKVCLVTFCSLFVPHLLVSLTDTHSLTCDVIVKAHTTPGQSWCEGQCSVDGEPCLQYDYDNKATPLGDLGKAINATPVWTDLVEKVEYLGQELRKKLANTNLRSNKISGKCGNKNRGRDSAQVRKGRAHVGMGW